jgi:hypothetical protein
MSSVLVFPYYRKYFHLQLLPKEGAIGRIAYLKKLKGRAINEDKEINYGPCWT